MLTGRAAPRLTLSPEKTHITHEGGHLFLWQAQAATPALVEFLQGVSE
ncbi:MAG: hypothetical protein ACLP50_04295 [Solirubrobacteraceae bacterium]